MWCLAVASSLHSKHSPMRLFLPARCCMSCFDALGCSQPPCCPLYFYTHASDPPSASPIGCIFIRCSAAHSLSTGSASFLQKVSSFKKENDFKGLPTDFTHKVQFIGREEDYSACEGEINSWWRRIPFLHLELKCNLYLHKEKRAVNAFRVESAICTTWS